MLISKFEVTDSQIQRFVSAATSQQLLAFWYSYADIYSFLKDTHLKNVDSQKIAEKWSWYHTVYQPFVADFPKLIESWEYTYSGYVQPSHDFHELLTVHYKAAVKFFCNIQDPDNRYEFRMLDRPFNDIDPVYWKFGFILEFSDIDGTEIKICFNDFISSKTITKAVKTVLKDIPGLVFENAYTVAGSEPICFPEMQNLVCVGGAV